ncbi:uncharacterized protein M421DRAFT_418345 [Didymella exigua CBS 183.55]|uniref:LIM zinc-binding domain-containing protein n=1 Tax=Didymella exigua CBS 183.55 TaxID=1150837 RepID=A0A6A5RU23_9PLEO|nr:uncharacterized protein M421DRAFT_418345 [Didymella exigua CBS 183.55]KAF1930870.1 hypothetical protein M421DRAFT_418345 [Didymella exigua CBS 183.55]
MQPTQWVAEGASTPGPGAYYTPQQMKSYLQDLRTNRPARPTGSRPPPAHFKTWSNRETSRMQDMPTLASLQAATDTEATAEAPAPAAPAPAAATPAAAIPASPASGPLRRREDLARAVEGAGKALVQPPRGRESATPSHERTSSVQYREDARRKAERRESGEIRAAMDKMDLKDEEKLYEAARDEAADIVWKHRNPNAPENNPDAPYAYPGPGRNALQRPKLQRTRSRSVGPSEDAEQHLQHAHSKTRKRHSIGSSTGSRSSSMQDVGAAGSDTSPTPSPLFSGSPSKNAFDLKIAKASSDLPQQRKTSGSRRKPSGSLFQNPNDHIYEEPEEEAPPAPAPTPMAAEPPKPAPLPLGMRRNPFTRFQSIKGNGMVRSNTDPVVSMRRFDRYEIHRNEPTQSRNAGYTLNNNKSKLSDVSKADAENEPEAKKKDGKEVRSDELRAATGFSLRNRSPKLPTPTMVSDAPGRPIVSFQKDYGVVELKEEKSMLPADPKPAPAAAPAAVPEPAPKPLEKSATEPIVPTRKSLFERPTSKSGAAPSLFERPMSRSGAAPSPFERPTSRSGASPSPFERPASRSASPFDRPASRSGAASSAPLKEFGPSSSPAPLGSGRPGTPKGPFANRSPLSRVNTASSMPSTPAASTVPADPYALPTASSTPPLLADPYALPSTSSRPQPPIPSISVSESRPASRSRFGRPQSVSNIPTISVSETPSTGHSRTGSIPSIGVTPPIPTISVSDSPAPTTAPPRGRFNRVSTIQAVPSISVNEPPAMTRGHSFNAPVINLPSDVPTIAVNKSPASRPVPTINAPSSSVTPSVPSIAINDPIPSTRPLPDPRNYNKRSAPPINAASRPSTSSRPLPSSARTHWTPTSVRTGAQCTHCALPISGRIVSAGGCRFHPECFSCYQCGEKLECVAFYPEPSAKHAARVERMRARQRGEDIGFLPGWDSAEKMAMLEEQDGTDESPRFYCHLDFHECFSPRCKSCTTPIEGEVVVACGAEWHPGHFFCAQCGDPFDSSTPFVEKDGYAWCVNCHTNRYSAKCKGCRKPVTDTVVKALGAEWHTGCFVCVECKGPFDDGRYFLRGESQDPVCVKCEERRLKA